MQQQQTLTHLVPRECKLEIYGDGPWLDEPDRAEWRVEGLPCIVRRIPLGTLCGYVAVPPRHPWHGMNYDFADVSVHGGLTYSEPCQHDVCHVVPESAKADEVWWFGFDCAHYLDVIPQMAYQALLRGSHGGGLFEGATYKDLAYVANETTELAQQIAAVPAWVEYKRRLVTRAITPRQIRQAHVFAGLAKRITQRRLPLARNGSGSARFKRDRW